MLAHAPRAKQNYDIYARCRVRALKRVRTHLAHVCLASETAAAVRLVAADRFRFAR